MALQTSAQTEHSIYTPLDKSTSQIRLLYLQPRLSPTLNNIICSLHLADLDDQTCQYEALSYEWGDADSISSYWIELDGGKRAVRENLWWALWYLRDEKAARVVWIDALCIDQDNEGEKNYQVRLMGPIYERASRVIAWIGREESPIPQKKGNPRMSTPLEVEAAFDFVNRLYGESEQIRFYRCSEVWYRGDKTKASSLPYTDLLEDNINCVTRTNRGWKFLLDIYKRSYWTRLWVVQEFVLAKNVAIQCGRFCLEWHALEHVCEELDGDSSSNVVPSAYNFLRGANSTAAQRIFQQRRRRLSLGTRSENLSDIFGLHHRAVCLDVRDKVFGLLGMSSVCCQEAIDVNYSIPKSELCRKFISHHMQHHQWCEVGEKQPKKSEFCGIIKTASLLFHDNNDDGNIGEQYFPDVFLQGSFRGIISGWRSPKENVESTQHSKDRQKSTTPTSDIFWKGNNRLLWPHDSVGRILYPWSTDDRGNEVVVHATFEMIWLHGDMRDGDLAYEIGQCNELILRKQDEGLLVVGKITTHPREEEFFQFDHYTLKESYADRLYLDYSALCALCQSVDFAEFTTSDENKNGSDNNIQEITRISTIRRIPSECDFEWW